MVLIVERAAIGVQETERNFNATPDSEWWEKNIQAAVPKDNGIMPCLLAEVRVASLQQNN